MIFLVTGAVSVDPSLSLDNHAVVLELGISKHCSGDSASCDSVVGGDKGVKLVPSPLDWGSGHTPYFGYSYLCLLYTSDAADE